MEVLHCSTSKHLFVLCNAAIICFDHRGVTEPIILGRSWRQLVVIRDGSATTPTCIGVRAPVWSFLRMPLSRAEVDRHERFLLGRCRAGKAIPT
jgi:hypothetical protein